MRLAGSGSADQHGIALLDNKAAARQIADQRLVDRRVGEIEVVDLLGDCCRNLDRVGGRRWSEPSVPRKTGYSSRLLLVPSSAAAVRQSSVNRLRVCPFRETKRQRPCSGWQSPSS
jgi:hypothetical protein